MNLCSTSPQSTCTNYILLVIRLVSLNRTLMTPMPTPPLPQESMYWMAFNESEQLAIIMRAQNFINQELIRMFNQITSCVDLRESFVGNELKFTVENQKFNQRQDKKM